MPKYRKKPVVIEAFQIQQAPFNPDEPMPKWLMVALWTNPYQTGAVYYDEVEGKGLLINTLEGTLRADWGDFIIQGVQGELYPCKPSIFHETYELVPEASN